MDGIAIDRLLLLDVDEPGLRRTDEGMPSSIASLPLAGLTTPCN